MRFLPAIIFLVALLAGCGPRAVLINPGTPVRLAEDADVFVYTRDSAGQWVRSPNAVKAPAGWYLVPPPPAK